MKTKINWEQYQITKKKGKVNPYSIKKEMLKCVLCKKQLSINELSVLNMMELHDVIFYGFSVHKKCFKKHINTFPHGRLTSPDKRQKL